MKFGGGVVVVNFGFVVAPEAAFSALTKLTIKTTQINFNFIAFNWLRASFL